MSVDYPNLVLVGKVFSGKTSIGRTLESEFGYTHINTGSYIRRQLAQTHPNQHAFSSSDYRVAREELIESTGELYFLNDDTEPVVVDGVRSLRVMQALAARRYTGVLIKASPRERLQRALDNDQIKHRVHGVTDLQNIDSQQARDVGMLLPYIKHEVVNGTGQNLKGLCEYILALCMDATT